MTFEEFEILKQGPYFKGKVITGSMIPVINIGEEIVVDVGNTEIKRFDIIVIWHNEKLVCHYLWNFNRIVEPILLQTRSMQGSKDVPVKLSHYFGKVISHKISAWQKFRILFL